MSNANQDDSTEASVSDFPLSELISPPLDSKEQIAVPARSALWGRARDALGGASTRATSASSAIASKAVELGKQSYAVTGATVGAAISYVHGELEERGAKQAIKSTAGAVVGKLDEVTGKRLVELLESRLQLQDEYNDILATRLAEALDRITVIERQLEVMAARSMSGTVK